MSLLSQKHLHDEEAAYAWVEAQVWPHGPQCPHCFEDKRVSKMEGKATRLGLYKCYACRKQFRVTVGTIFEKSKVPLHKWLQAFYLIAGSKKGISANQLHRTLGVTLKTAWFMGHRIREAMRHGSFSPPMGGDGEVVEVDETIYGRAATHPKGRIDNPRKHGITNSAHKNVILSLVQRGGGVRSFHVKGSTIDEVIPVVNKNVAKETAMMTDKAQLYKKQLKDFASHDWVDHSKNEWTFDYGDGSPLVHTNTVESYFGLFKRGMRGTYQHCKEKHLHRYLAEFDFRYNNRVRLGIDDEARAVRLIKGIRGKRLTYRTTGAAGAE